MSSWSPMCVLDRVHIQTETLPRFGAGFIRATICGIRLRSGNSKPAGARGARGEFMGQSPRRWRPVASAMSVIFGAFMLSACASDAMHTPLIPAPPSDPKETAPATATLPGNYRELMAGYILTHNRYVIRDARITPPYERYGGLVHGGTMPAVCVAIYRDNPLGILVRDNRVLTWENGQVQEIRLGMEPCTDLSPFTELKRRLPTN